MGRKSIEERFWSKVIKPGEENADDGCWEWAGCRPRRSCGVASYGRFSTATSKSVLAHRFSWELHNGPIPDGMVVCHRCDNTGCVRPEHLFVGTQADNLRDCQSKGRRWDQTSFTPLAVGRICRNGHHIDDDYFLIYDRGYVYCRYCHREASLRYVQKRRDMLRETQ